MESLGFYNKNFINFYYEYNKYGVNNNNKNYILIINSLICILINI